jgi:hypothetical protein
MLHISYCAKISAACSYIKLTNHLHFWGLAISFVTKRHRFNEHYDLFHVLH